MHGHISLDNVHCTGHNTHSVYNAQYSLNNIHGTTLSQPFHLSQNTSIRQQMGFFLSIFLCEYLLVGNVDILQSMKYGSEDLVFGDIFFTFSLTIIVSSQKCCFKLWYFYERSTICKLSNSPRSFDIFSPTSDTVLVMPWLERPWPTKCSL